MIDAGILDGDIAVVQRQQDARDSDIVVALAGDDESADEATMKRFFTRENPAYRPATEKPRSAGLLYSGRPRGRSPHGLQTAPQAAPSSPSSMDLF